MKYWRIKILYLMVACLLLTLTGCPAAQKKPGPSLQGEPTIRLYVKETGQIKQIKLEEYLLGVVAAEMDPTWPQEALAAQAILARTFTFEKMSRGGVPQRNADASTDVEEFQAYDPSRINDNVRRAVTRTRGEVARYQGRYIKAWFFADGGGRTAASAQEGLAYNQEPTPYIHSVEDPGFRITVPENKAWRVAIPLTEVRQAIKEKAGQDPGTITSAKILTTGPSGRAVTVQVGNAKVSAPALRIALGNDRVRSTLISQFTVSGGNLVVAGKGYGHGVGMSQWGARAMAEQGKKAEDIVKYFFKDITIDRAYR